MDYTESSFSPPIFRKWALLALVAATVERKVWCKVAQRPTFPSIYTFLVAPPGVGKQVIDVVRDLAAELLDQTGDNAIAVSPDSMTKASLVDELVKRKKTWLCPDGSNEVYHALFVAAEEISVFMPNYDNEFLGVINAIYNNKSVHTETRRTGTVKEAEIAKPMLNILAGVQPGWMASVFPEEAWTTGLTSRLFMVYCGQGIHKDLFEETPNQNYLEKVLLERLSRLASLWGEFSFTGEARGKLIDWHLKGGPPIPRHSKLENYNRRRTNQHVIKLAMLSSLCRGTDLEITLRDCVRAIGWMTEVESFMPDIFRAMTGKSDMAIVEELGLYVNAQFKMSGPVREDLVYEFISQRAPADKVAGILAIAERCDMLRRVAGAT
jgi:hypothetical protein